MAIRIIGSGGVDETGVWRNQNMLLKFSSHEEFKEGVKRSLSEFNVRRLDTLTKLYLLATEEARIDANIEVMDGIGLITAMKFGPWDSIAKMLDKVAETKFQDLGPLLFPQTTFNHAAGQLCIQYGIHDFSNSLVSSCNVDLQALEMAKIMLETHQLKKVILVAGDFIEQDIADAVSLRSSPKSISAVVLEENDEKKSNSRIIVSVGTGEKEGRKLELGAEGSIQLVSSDGFANDRLKYIFNKETEHVTNRKITVLTKNNTSQQVDGGFVLEEN